MVTMVTMVTMESDLGDINDLGEDIDSLYDLEDFKNQTIASLTAQSSQVEGTVRDLSVDIYFYFFPEIILVRISGI